MKQILGGCIATLIGLTLTSCSATCLRDSDCIGASVCHQDRCILVVRRDVEGGVETPSPTTSPDPTTPTSGTPQSPDASTSLTALDVAGGATPAREILDAAPDTAPTTSGL